MGVTTFRMVLVHVTVMLRHRKAMSKTKLTEFTLAERLSLDLNFIALNAHFVAGNPQFWAVNPSAIGQLKFPTVPDATDHIVLYRSLGQTSSHVRTIIIDGKELPTGAVEHRDRLGSNLESPGCSFGEITHFRNRHKIGHAVPLENYVEWRSETRTTS